jgi:hypothetical protein
MEDWEPDEIASLDGRRAYFWVVPANVQGSWTLEAAGQKNELALEQVFQKITGYVALGALHAGLREPLLSGFDIAFAYVDSAGVRRELSGRVSNGKMEGSFSDDKGAEGRWTATKR